MPLPHRKTATFCLQKVRFILISCICLWSTLHHPHSAKGAAASLNTEPPAEFCFFESTGNRTLSTNTMSCNLPYDIQLSWCPGVNVVGVERLNVTLTSSVINRLQREKSPTGSDQPEEDSIGVTLDLSCILLRFENLRFLAVDQRITCQNVESDVFKPSSSSPLTGEEVGRDGCILLTGCGMHQGDSTEMKNGEKKVLKNSTHEWSFSAASTTTKPAVVDAAGSEPFHSVGHELNDHYRGADLAQPDDELMRGKATNGVEEHQVYKVFPIGKDDLLTGKHDDYSPPIIGRTYVAVKEFNSAPLALDDLIDPGDEAEAVLHFVAVKAKPLPDHSINHHGKQQATRAMSGGSSGSQASVSWLLVLQVLLFFLVFAC